MDVEVEGLEGGISVDVQVEGRAWELAVKKMVRGDSGF